MVPRDRPPVAGIHLDLHRMVLEEVRQVRSRPRPLDLVHDPGAEEVRHDAARVRVEGLRRSRGGLRAHLVVGLTVPVEEARQRRQPGLRSGRVHRGLVVGIARVGRTHALGLLSPLMPAESGRGARTKAGSPRAKECRRERPPWPRECCRRPSPADWPRAVPAAPSSPTRSAGSAAERDRSPPSGPARCPRRGATSAGRRARCSSPNKRGPGRRADSD